MEKTMRTRLDIFHLFHPPADLPFGRLFVFGRGRNAEKLIQGVSNRKIPFGKTRRHRKEQRQEEEQQLGREVHTGKRERRRSKASARGGGGEKNEENALREVIRR